LDKLHEKGVPTVIITSIELNSIPPSFYAPKLKPSPYGYLHLLASHRNPETGIVTKRIMVSFPKLPASFTGTGDLLAALLLANLDKAQREEREKSGNGGGVNGVNSGKASSNVIASTLKIACERAIASMQGVLNETVKKYSLMSNNSSKDNNSTSNSQTLKCRELCIVQSQPHILNPTIEYTAEEITIS
jgi:pyridoxal/pyridoxine/pyridoxamine kinase